MNCDVLWLWLVVSSEYFLPLLINESHGERAFPLIEDTIARLLNPSAAPAPASAGAGAGAGPTPRLGYTPVYSQLSDMWAQRQPASAAAAAAAAGAGAPVSAVPEFEFKPVHALKVICTLMNSMVVGRC
jgi:hypothetical protein